MPPIPYRFRPPRSSPESRAGRPPEPRAEHRGAMLIERDVPVTTAAGHVIRIDVYRPAEGRVPALVAWSPYGKHNPAPIGTIYPASGAKPEHMGPLTTFEAPDPDYWVPHGYAIITADVPGTWYSTGPATFLSPEEAEDYRDLIEWAGVQPWSTGRIGTSGVSYLTSSQWRVAELNPPHLAAINPWEGWSDTYAEVARHGGIPETSFWPYIWERWGASAGDVIEDLEAETAAHPFDDEFWRSKAAQLERIRVPAWVVGSWSDQGLHTRGTLEGFRRMSSEQKWLDVHGRKKWAEYYLPEQVERQRQFFDHFLKGEENGWGDRPRVLVEEREAAYVGRMRAAETWPLPEVEYRSLYLAPGRLVEEALEEEQVVEYDGLGSGLRPRQAVFEHVFAERTVLIGHATAELQVSAPDAPDMDLFVALFKRDAAGAVVGFPHYAQFEDGPVALGWLRVSRRELDTERSLPSLPVLAHRRDLPMAEDGPTAVTIEILPSGTVFEAGESLVLVVQGRDVLDYAAPLTYPRHHQTVNAGRHRIHTGGEQPSRLILPHVPADH
jgi:predicted acyl esterase